MEVPSNDTLLKLEFMKMHHLKITKTSMKVAHQRSCPTSSGLEIASAKQIKFLNLDEHGKNQHSSALQKPVMVTHTTQ